MLASHRREARLEHPLLGLRGEHSRQEEPKDKADLSLMVLAICHRNRKLRTTRGNVMGMSGLLRN